MNRMSFGFSAGDILSIGQLCWTVYRACRDAAGHYEEVTTELKSLHVNLKVLAEEIGNPKSLLNRRAAAMQDEFNHILGSVQRLLAELETMVTKYRSLATMEKRTWDRLRFGLKDLNIIRQRLTYHTTQMELFVSSLTAGALGRIESLLEEFISEVRSGRREPTILSIEHGGEEAELGWNQLERDLSENGVSSKDIDRHREDILEYLTLLTANSEVPLQDTIVSLALTSDSNVSDDEAEEDNWDSISQRIESNNDNEFRDTDATSNSSIDSEMCLEPPEKLKSAFSPVLTPIELLEENGFDIDYDVSKLPIAMGWAADVGNLDVIRFLLLRRPRITARNGYGDLIRSVILGGSEECLRALIEYGVDMNMSNEKGWTALFWAVVHEKPKMVEMLLNPYLGVVVDKKDTIGLTPLHFAAISTNEEFTQMLIYSGVDVNAKNYKRQTALHGAATNGLKDNIRLLLNAGANIEATTEEGLTALRLAFENGHDNVVRLLLQRGANIRSAYIGRFAPSPKNPEISMEGIEAGRLAILWWEEENNKKAQAAMAINNTNQLRANHTDGPRRKAQRRKKDSTVKRILDFIY